MQNGIYAARAGRFIRAHAENLVGCWPAIWFASAIQLCYRVRFDSATQDEHCESSSCRSLDPKVRGAYKLLQDSVLGNRKRFHVPILPGPFDVSRDHSVSSNCSCGAIKWPDGRLIDFTRSTDTRKGEQTRQEIIRKAVPVFNQKGYSGAALSDLMRATGLEKGGI
jgi:hypothetical protein